MTKPARSRVARTQPAKAAPHVVAAPSSPSRPSSRTIESPAVRKLLDKLQGLSPSYPDPVTEAFIESVFSDQSVMAAYLLPKPVEGIEYADMTAEVGSELNEKPQWIPMAVMTRAAGQSLSMGLIRPFERCLTHLATMLYPCGLFYCHYVAQAFPERGQGKPFHFDEVAVMRGLLLESPLRKLKARNPALANTLAAVLGLPYEVQDVNEEQVARIASAVCLANLKVTAIWAPHQTS